MVQLPASCAYGLAAGVWDLVAGAGVLAEPHAVFPVFKAVGPAALETSLHVIDGFCPACIDAVALDKGGVQAVGKFMPHLQKFGGKIVRAREGKGCP